MVRIRDMLVAFAIFGVIFILASCGEPRQPTACEQEQALVRSYQNAVDDQHTYFHTLVEDYSAYYKPVCVHGFPYFQETPNSAYSNNLSLVPIPEKYYAFSGFFFEACMKLEQAKKPAPKGVADQGGAQ